MRSFALLTVGALVAAMACSANKNAADDEDDAGASSGATGGSGGSGGAGGSTGGSSGTGPMTYTPTPGGYYVAGNKILDANGQVHVFRGVSRPSFEWSIDGELITYTDWQNMKSWGANVVRIPMNQYFWRTKPVYRQRIAISIGQINDTGMDVILDLHWSEGPTPGTDQVPGAQQEMADSGSVTFWQEVANEYKANSRVLFELYNEPKLVSGGDGWGIWQNGGSVAGFTAVGMNQLYAAVRGTGATNIVILGGIDWAYDLTGVLSHPITGAMNVAYAVHPYHNNGKMPTDWEADWGAVIPMFPVIVTEFGRHDGSCDTAYLQQVLSYASSRQLGWVGWAWYPKDCSFPSLISAWDGTPTASGAIVKNALLAAQAQ